MKKGFAPIAVAVLLLMVAGLGLVVTRTTNLQNVFQKPKAEGLEKKCSVSISLPVVGVGEAVTVTSSGTGGTARSIISRTDTGNISGLGSPTWTDNQGHKYYIVSNPTVSGLTEGTYKVWCDMPGDPGQCSGNPFCPAKGGTIDPVQCAGWAVCGANDNATLIVTAVEKIVCVDSQCRDNEACQGSSCQPLFCVTPVDWPCKTLVARNHSCQPENLPNEIACSFQAGGGPGTCQNGVCTVLPTANECEVCEGLLNKTCASGFTCRYNSPDQGGICLKSDGTSQCGTCTADADCHSEMVCAGGKCVEPANCQKDSDCLDTETCAGGKCAKVICPITSPVCKVHANPPVSNHVCQFNNVLAGADCSAESGITGGKCDGNGNCAAPAPGPACSNVTITPGQ